MNTKKTMKALDALAKAIEALEKAGIYECANEIEQMYDGINGELCQQIEKENQQ